MTDTNIQEYDVLVLGSGAAGKLLSWKMASQGMKVAVVERKYIGGSCPNIACLPSKNVIHSAKVASFFRHSEEFGIHKDNWTIDMNQVRERKRNMVNHLVDVHVKNYQKSGAELIMGEGRFVAPKTIEVKLNAGGVRMLRGKKVLIDTGTHAIVDATPGLRESNPITHIEALELDQIPKHLVVLGGGFVGLEFAQAMRRLGSQVTVIDRNARIAPREDDDIAEGLYNLLSKEGIEFIMNARVTQIEGKSGDAVKLHVTLNGSEKIIEGTHLLAAAGRQPNTANIGLELIGVETTANGYVKVNERLETTAPDVYAAGDVAGSPQFTHIAENDFQIVAENMLGGSRVTTGRLVPYVLFTDPEYARIGLSEKEAGEKGIAYKLAKIPFGAILRAQTLGETNGFMKALIDPGNDQVIGFHALGVDAGEIMGAVQIAMMAKLPYTILRDAPFAHPTLVEGLVPLFSNVQS